MDVEVTVDADLCIGSGDCARLVPSAFRIDETLGVSIPLRGATSVDIVALREAARSCPTQAIQLDLRVQHGDLPPAPGRGR